MPSRWPTRCSIRALACITDLMVKEGLINLDFADVRAVMREMGKAMMGTGEAAGEKRALAAAEAAIANPLIDDSSMKGAKGLLISITGGRDLTLYEVDEAATRIREEVDQDANIIVGATFDEGLEGVIRVSVVATGIDKVAIEQPAPAATAKTVENVSRVRLETPRVAERTAEPAELRRPPRAAMPAPTAPAALSRRTSRRRLKPLSPRQSCRATQGEDVTIRPLQRSKPSLCSTKRQPRRRSRPCRPHLFRRRPSRWRTRRMPRFEELADDRPGGNPGATRRARPGRYPGKAAHEPVATTGFGRPWAARG